MSCLHSAWQHTVTPVCSYWVRAGWLGDSGGLQPKYTHTHAHHFCYLCSVLLKVPQLHMFYYSLCLCHQIWGSKEPKEVLISSKLVSAGWLLFFPCSRLLGSSYSCGVACHFWANWKWPDWSLSFKHFSEAELLCEQNIISFSWVTAQTLQHAVRPTQLSGWHN